jgi:hypothetical protein
MFPLGLGYRQTCDLLNDSRGSLLGKLKFLCKMGNDLRFGHGFFGHFYAPVGMKYKSRIAGVYWKMSSDASRKSVASEKDFIPG